MEAAIVYFLLLSNCGFIVGGFFLKSCYLSQDESASCTDRSLTKVPTDIPSTVKSIKLHNNNISKIQVSNFIHFPNLTSLILSQNHISEIGRRTFSQLISLKWLSLSQNILITLEDYVFDGLSKLTDLRIDFNQIQTVAPNAFRSLSSLLVLDLSNNKLQTIAQVHLFVQHMPNLRDLMIRNNDITTFRSQDLTNTSVKIQFLDVSENPLEKFEVAAKAFPKLQKLNISGVQLVSLEEWRKLYKSFSSLNYLILNSMQHTTALINISCSTSTIRSLQINNYDLFFFKPDLFQMCHQLTNIDLKGNNITHIENGSFAVFHSLRILTLSNNRLVSVPAAKRNMASLQTLDLSFNRIKTIECQDFTGLKNLKNLYLMQNNIAELNSCTFLGLSKLTELSLQGNSLLEIGSAFQSGLSNLKNLQLNQNKLAAIAKSAFSGLRSLTKLSLDHNQIQTLEKGSFYGLKNLKTLQLQNNKLRKEALDAACFNDLVNLKTLHLESNHINYEYSSPLKVPPFMNLSSLETLIIAVQNSPGKSKFPSNFLQGLTNLLILDCTKIQLKSFTDDFFIHTPHLTSLDISNNYLYDVSPALFAPISNLSRLRITRTYLRSLNFLINSNLTKLKILQARKNVFSVISESSIKSVPSLLELDVKSNGFSCDCDNSWFVHWIQNNSQTQVMDADTFRCNYSPQRTENHLFDLNLQSCLVDIGFICFVCSTCVNILILVASFTFHFSRFHLKYAYYLFLAWLNDSRNRQKRAACQFDAFVSYNAHDEAWVYRELVPHLEQEQGWRLCLHHRDFIPGTPILQNIVEAIYGSRKTLCVISRRYLQSEWCSKEMQLASFRLFDEREDVLILVFLEDIPSSHVSPYYRMKRLLKRRSYLSWPRAAQHPQLFWEKLRQALRSTNSEEEDRLRLTVAH